MLRVGWKRFLEFGTEKYTYVKLFEMYLLILFCRCCSDCVIGLENTYIIYGQLLKYAAPI